MMIARTASTARGSRTSTVGSNSMPTETKNSTANASFNGSESLPAWCDSSDSDRMTPAKNAPSAKDTPNAAEDPYAMPSATGSPESENNPREPVRETRASSHGTARVPTTSASTTN